MDRIGVLFDLVDCEGLGFLVLWEGVVNFGDVLNLWVLRRRGERRRSFVWKGKIILKGVCRERQMDMGMWGGGSMEG